jgi:hypothetical protein
MPVASSLNELRDALKTRETNITRALKDLFEDPGTLAGHPHRPDLGTPYILSSKQPGDMLPDWATDELQGRVPGSPVKKSLSDDEIAHLNNWPKELREDLRKVLDPRAPGDPHLKFHWELHGKDVEEIDFSVPGEVIFRSPQQNLSFSGATFVVWSKVKVGK